MAWLDSIVTSCASDVALVRTSATLLPGLYQKMRQDQHSDIEAKLTNYVDRITEVRNANITPGIYIAVEGAGVGHCSMFHKKIGIFQ